MLRLEGGWWLRLDIPVPTPPPLILKKRILPLPPLAGHMDCWDEGWIKLKGDKHSAHSFSCFDLTCSCSKGHRSEEENMWGRRPWEHNPV